MTLHEMMIDQSSKERCNQHFNYLDTLILVFVIVLLLSNLIAQKVCRLGPFTVSGAELFFPITYVFGDLFTEVYGYRASRRAIWVGFWSSILLSVFGAIAVALPADPSMPNQSAFALVFGMVPRLVAASLIAYWVGEFANAFVLAKLKLLTNGRWLWTRTIGSTVVGQGLDTILFMGIAFAGEIPSFTLFRLIFWSYLIKVAYEVVATPITYGAVDWLKRREQLDSFDVDTDFNPFSISSSVNLER